MVEQKSALGKRTRAEARVAATAVCEPQSEDIDLDAMIGTSNPDAAKASNQVSDAGQEADGGTGVTNTDPNSVEYNAQGQRVM